MIKNQSPGLIQLIQNKPRFAVLTAFFSLGTLMATWISRIPFIKSSLNLSEGILGLVLMSLSIGVIIFLSIAGGLISRFTSSRMTLFGALGMCLILPILAIIPNPILIAPFLFLFGGLMSIMDVSMNEQAVLVERNIGRPLMSSFHASYSLGGLVGSLIGSALINHLSTFQHFLVISIFFAIIILIVSSALLPSPQIQKIQGSVFRFPDKALWLIGFIAFCSVLADNSVVTWSGIYLSQDLLASPSFAALGYGAFSLTMMIGRLLGDKLTAQFAPHLVVRTGAAITIVGFLVITLTTTPLIALLGYAAIGLGISNNIPLAFSAAGNHPTISPAVGIAGVAAIGYSGFLVGPPILGYITELSSLRFAYLFALLLISTLFFTSRTLHPKS